MGTKTTPAALLALVALALAGPGLAFHAPVGSPRTDCEPVSDWKDHEYNTAPSAGLVPVNPAGAGAKDGNTQDCDGVGGPDFDGHREFMAGGALLHSEYAASCPTADVHHHAVLPYVQVFDYVLASVTFTVAVDAVDLTGGACGDFVFDTTVSCVDSCNVPFPSGLDGTYHVLVDGDNGVVRAT